MSSALRVGGAFIAVGAALFLITVVQVLMEGWMAPFAVTWGFLALMAAAAILGAFATVDKTQPGSKRQVIALAVAVALLILARIVPSTPLAIWSQYWLPAYALAAVACGLVIRRRVMA